MNLYLVLGFVINILAAITLALTIYQMNWFHITMMVALVAGGILINMGADKLENKSVKSSKK